MDKIKTIFIGSGEFAIPIFKTLLDMPEVSLVAVITQPDKNAGRGNEMTPTVLAKYVQDNTFHNHIPLLKPEKLRLESSEILNMYMPDLVIVSSYGQMIPDDMLTIPQYGCLNIHGSLLPLLRGAVPVPMSILLGFKHTGVSIQRMVKELDKGDVYIQECMDIEEDDTSYTLMEKLAELGANLLKESLLKIVSGELKAVAQDDSKATYCYQEDISKEKAEITRETDVLTVERMIRAFYPRPVAWTYIEVNGERKRLQVFRGSIVEDVTNSTPNKYIFRFGKDIYLELNNGFLRLDEVQLEGKRRMRGKEYLFLAS